MSIGRVIYYQASCDQVGCHAKTGDVGEYAAWADPQQARDDWEDAGGIVLGDGRTFCPDHVQGRICAGCNHKGTDLTEHEGDYWCAECLAEERS